jgi:hypothetical protein
MAGTFPVLQTAARTNLRVSIIFSADGDLPLLNQTTLSLFQNSNPRKPFARFARPQE